MTETWPSLLAAVALLCVGVGLGMIVTAVMKKIDHR